MGKELGHSGPHRVGQHEITAFARATGDHQWIHVDPARAEAGPFGTTIAHGYYLLAVMPTLLAQIYRIDGVGAVINTGVDGLRFHRPVPVGSVIRARARLVAMHTHRRGVADISIGVEVLVEGNPEPACTAVVHCMVRPAAVVTRTPGR